MISDVNVDRSSNVAVEWAQLLLPVTDLRYNKNIATFIITYFMVQDLNSEDEQNLFMYGIRRIITNNKSESLNFIQSHLKRGKILFLLDPF